LATFSLFSFSFFFPFLNSNNTPFDFLVHLRKLAKVHQATELPKARFAKKDSLASEVEVDGVTVRVAALGDLYRQIIGTLTLQLKGVLFGIVIPSNLPRVQENPSDQGLGFSAIVPGDDIKAALYRHADYGSPLSFPFDEFSFRAADVFSTALYHSDLGWNAEHMRFYLEKTSKIMTLLLVAIHLSSGQPARATELETMIWTNTGTRVRSLYASQGKAVFPNKPSNTKTINPTTSPPLRCA